MGFMTLMLVGAGCGQANNRGSSDLMELNNSSMDKMNSDAGVPETNGNPGGVPDASATKDGYKFYISTEKSICSSQGAKDTCKTAGAEFFQDDQGCGCYSSVK